MDPLEILLLKPLPLAYFQKMTKACLSIKIDQNVKYAIAADIVVAGGILHKMVLAFYTVQNTFSPSFIPQHYGKILFEIHRQLESNTHYGRKKFLTNVIYQSFLVTFSFYAHIAHHTQRMLHQKENTGNKFNFCYGGKAFFYYISKY